MDTQSEPKVVPHRVQCWEKISQSAKQSHGANHEEGEGFGGGLQPSHSHHLMANFSLLDGFSLREEFSLLR